MNRLHFATALAALIAFPVVLPACVGGDTDENPETAGSDLSSEASNNKAAFEFFVKKGLTKVQAAGIVGNLDQESSMSPTVKQFGGGPGRGIAQWSAGGRWDRDHDDNVAWYAKAHGESEWSLTTQLNFIWFELTEKGYGYSKLKKAKTITEATVVFMEDFEGCGECDESNRVKYAEEAYSKYK